MPEDFRLRLPCSSMGWRQIPAKLEELTGHAEEEEERNRRRKGVEIQSLDSELLLELERDGKPDQEHHPWPWEGPLCALQPQRFLQILKVDYQVLALASFWWSLPYYEMGDGFWIKLRFNSIMAFLSLEFLMIWRTATNMMILTAWSTCTFNESNLALAPDS